MPDDARLYRMLFRSISAALEQMQIMNYGFTRDILVNAQKYAEEMYVIDDPETCDEDTLSYAEALENRLYQSFEAIDILGHVPDEDF